MKQIKYTYHHTGIPTKTPKVFRIQWHRFDEGCPLHPLLQTMPHIAFKVTSIDEAIKDKNVLLQPYYPFEGFRVAAIEVDGAPIELIETNLSENEIWDDPHENSVIYPKQSI